MEFSWLTIEGIINIAMGGSIGGFFNHIHQSWYEVSGQTYYQGLWIENQSGGISTLQFLFPKFTICSHLKTQPCS